MSPPPPTASSTTLPRPATAAPDATTAAPDANTLALWLARIRVRDWLHFLALPFAALALGFDATMTAPLARGVLVSGCVLAFGYLINGVGDRAMDSEPGKNVLTREAPRTYAAPLLGLALAALAFAATGPAVVLGATAVALVSGVLYSVGPRWKRVPVVGTLMNVTHFTPLLFVGLASSADAWALAPLAAAFAALLLENQLIHEAADAPDDRAGGVYTTFSALGANGCAVAAVVLGLAVAGASLPLLSAAGASPVWALHAVPHVLVFPALLAARGDDPARMRRARLHHRLAALLSGVVLFAAGFV